MDRETVLRLARLSQIQLSDEELVGVEAQLTRLLGCFAALGRVNTDTVDASGLTADPGTEPSETAIDANTTRGRNPSLSQAQVLDNAPRQDDGQFVVPRVIGGDKPG